MNASPEIDAVAAALAGAALTRVPIEPVGGSLQAFGIDGAYAVQTRLARTAVASGRRICGRKIGLTSRAVQSQLGVDQPDFGVLFADMEFLDGDEVPLDRFIQPRIEAEIAFVMRAPVTAADATLADVISAVAYALPAIEIVDSRIRDWRISILDTIADNASSGAYVLGGSPVAIERLDLRLAGMVLEARGEPVSVGCAAACLGNPLHALRWLARRMAAGGQPLAAGDLVLSGALGPLVTVAAGIGYAARIHGLGAVHLRFSS